MAARAEPDVAAKKKVGEADEVLEECARLERELVELQVSWEQFFLGNDRKPPTRRYEDFKRSLRQLKDHFVQQTSVRFRIGNVAQRFSTYSRLWERTIKEIEDGTYLPHIFKARLHARAREKKPPAEPTRAAAAKAPVEDEDLDLSDLDDDLESALQRAAGEPATAPVKPVVAVPPKVAAGLATTSKPALPGVGTPATGAQTLVKPANAGAPLAVKGQVPARPVAAQAGGATAGLTDTKIKAIYDAYVLAKRRCGEDTTSLSLASIAATLKKQVPELMKQHKAKSVEFKVVIKDGKAVLRALPKE